MYKIIIVDDEEEVRKGIVNKINWQDIGFEIVGEAENGIEALEIAERTIPDVVITDIKMPFLDGMSLSKQLRSEFPTINIVILTGFDEFEYAQKAININVFEYVLKPISSKELIKVLLRVKEKIDYEAEQMKNLKDLKEHYLNSLPILREKFLVSLITNGIEKCDIIQKSKYYSIDIQGIGYIVSIISLDNNAFNKSDNIEDRYKIWEKKELLRYQVLAICNEIVSKNNIGLLFLNNEEIIIISILKKNESDLIGRTFTCLEEIRQTIEKFLKFTVTIGIGTLCDSVESLYISYQNAISAIDYRMIVGNNKIIYIEDIEPQCIDKVLFDERMGRELTTCIKVGTKDEINNTLDNLFKVLFDSKVSIKDCQIYLLEMLTTILKAAKESNVDLENIFGKSYNLFLELDSLKDMLEVKKWMVNICEKIISYILKDRQSICNILVDKAKSLVLEHYSDSDISINSVCDLLHISQTYFSFIFKRETKITFVNFLTGVRMNAAKELIRSTNMKSFEISEAVGYSEPNYFSYCFKKNFGISPSEYRNKNNINS